jgi:hypothetical protein
MAVGMSEIGKLLLERQRASGMSPEQYAHEIGLTVNGFYKYTRSYANSPEHMTTKVTRRLGEYFRLQGDQEMVAALASFAVGGSVEKILMAA